MTTTDHRDADVRILPCFSIGTLRGPAWWVTRHKAKTFEHLVVVGHQPSESFRIPEAVVGLARKGEVDYVAGVVFGVSRGG